MYKIKVLLAEDHTIVRKGLRTLLDADEDLEVVGEAEDGRQAVALTQQKHPDVVLMDISMPILNGLEATRQIKRLSPSTEVVMLTMHASEEYVFQTLRAGASGYVLKQAAVEELLLALRTVVKGGSFLSPSISSIVIEEYCRRAKATEGDDDYETLSEREREVLQLVAEGRSNREIAELLCLTPKTVQVHRANLMAKLGIRGTAELTRYAIRRGMVIVDQYHERLGRG